MDQYHSIFKAAVQVFNQEDCEGRTGFYIDDDKKEDDDFNFVSMKTFEILVEDYNLQFKSVNDILAKLKELNNILNNK